MNGLSIYNSTSFVSYIYEEMNGNRFDKNVVEILEGIPNAFYVLDKAWNFIYANPQIEKLLGKTNDELRGMHFWNIFPKTLFPELYEQFNKASQTGHNVIFNEYSPKFAKWFGINIYPSSSGVVVYVTDNTEKVKTEQELVRVKEELQDFLDQAAIGVHSVNEDGTILYVNKAELDLLGRSKDECVGHNIAEFHADQDAIADILVRLKKKEIIDNYEARLLHKNGTIRHVLISSNVAWKDDKFMHTRCFTRDITARKKMEQLLVLLNRSGELLASTLDIDEALSKLSQLIVPDFSNWFSVYELKNGHAHVLSMNHEDREILPIAVEYRKNNPINLQKIKPKSLAWVLKIGASSFIPYVTAADLESIATDRAQLEMIHTVGITSLIMVPMRLKGVIIGAATFTSTNANRHFDTEDLRFAEDLANRIAFTLENARLYNQVKFQLAREIRSKEVN